MFEREIQFIYDFNQNKVKKLGSFMTFEQIQSIELHPAILQYISGEIDFLIFEDRQKLLNDSLFDYSGENIGRHFSLISGEIKKVKRFSISYIEKLILHASSFTVNYLIRPNWSLLRFIFEDEKEKSTLEIKQILNYLFYYPYLKKIISSYFDKKKLYTISYDSFNELLIKIDKAGLESDYTKIVDEALDSMAEFFNIGVYKKRLVPVKAVELFLKDKSLNSHVRKLISKFNDPSVNKYDVLDVMRVLHSVVYEKEEIIEELESPKTTWSEEISTGTKIDEPEEDQTSTPEREEEFIISNEISSEKNIEVETLNSIPGKEQESDMMDSPPVFSDVEEKFQSGTSELDSVLESIEEKEESKEINREEMMLDVKDEIVIQEKQIEDSEDIADHVEVKTEEISGEDYDAAKELYMEETGNLESEEEFSEDEVIDDYHELDVKDEKIFIQDESEIETGLTEKSSIQQEIEDVDELDFITRESETEQPLAEEPDEEIDLSKIDETMFKDDKEEPSLFKEEDFDEKKISSSELETIKEMNMDWEESKNSDDIKPKSLDITEILGNKKMSRILDIIFDYDMEDFANTIERITDSKSKEEAFHLIERVCENAQISPTSKEAKAFKSIIEEYFDRK